MGMDPHKDQHPHKKQLFLDKNKKPEGAGFLLGVSGVDYRELTSPEGAVRWDEPGLFIIISMRT